MAWLFRNTLTTLHATRLATRHCLIDRRSGFLGCAVRRVCRPNAQADGPRQRSPLDRRPERQTRQGTLHQRQSRHLNLLPIPVLDGGHMVFATIEKLRGQPLPIAFLERAQILFVALLFSFMLYVTFFDLQRIFPF